MAENATDLELRPLEVPLTSRRQSFVRQHNIKTSIADSIGNIERQQKNDTTETKSDEIDSPFTWYLLEEFEYSSYVKRFFRLVALVNILSLTINGPVTPQEYLGTPPNCEDIDSKKVHFAILLAVDVILSIFYSILLFFRAQNSRHWHKLKALKDAAKTTGMRSRWLNYNHWARLIPIVITTLGLYGSVIVEIVRLRRENYEVHPALYIVFVLRVVTLVSAIKLFSPLKVSGSALQSLITKFRLKHLANVTVFYIAVLYIYALVGVHQIGPLDYHCVNNNVTCENGPLSLCWEDYIAKGNNCTCDNSSCDMSNSSCDMNDSSCDMSDSSCDMNDSSCDMNDRNNSCVSLHSLSIPDLQCQPNDTDSLYTCPEGYSCCQLIIGRNFGFYGHYDHLGVSLLAVYEVSTLELWSFQSYTARYGGHDARVYFLTIIFLLVIIVQQSIFLVVIIESFADVRSDPNLIIRSKPQPRPDFLLTDNSRTDELELTQSHQVTIGRLEFLQLPKHYWPYFSKLMIVLVLVDAFIVAARGNKMETYSDFVDIWEVIISIIFLLELLPYMAFYTPSTAVKRWQFWYLSIVALGSFVAACFIKAKGYKHLDGPERILVVFQALRFPRLTFLFSPITKFFNDIIGKDRRIPIITVITLFFILGITIIHFQLFAHTERGKQDIWGYRSFIGAFRSTFQIVIGEGWSEVMGDLMFRNSAWWILNIVFILTHLVASLILLNLFVAIILDNLDKDEEKKRSELQEQQLNRKGNDVPRHLELLEKVLPAVGSKVKVAGGFDVPNIDESVVKEYIQQGEQKLQEAVKQQLHRRRMSSYVEEDEEEEEEDIVHGVDSDKLQLINVDSSQMLMVSNRRKSDSIGQMVEKISMWRRWSVSSENNESFSQANTLTLLRHITTNRSFSENLTFKPCKHTKLDEYLKQRPYINWSFCLLRNDNSFRKLCRMILEVKLNASSVNAAQKDSKFKFLKRFLFLILSVISQLPYFTWFMLFCTATLIIVQLHQLEHEHGYFRKNVNCSNTSVNFCGIPLYHHNSFMAADIVFVLVTTIELLLKAVAYGTFFGPRRIIHSIWDLISWLIVIATVVVLAQKYTIPPISKPSQFDYLAAMMLLLWALRPIRIISIVPAMRRGIADIVKGKVNFLMAFFLLGGFLFMFASLGVQLFQDRFKFCNDFSKARNISDCVGEFHMSLQVSSELIVPSEEDDVTMLVPRVLVQQPREFGFDDFVAAFSTLFEVLTLEGWITVRDFQTNFVDVYNDHWSNSTDRAFVVYINLYLHIFVFFAVTIGLQLFVGIIVSSFNENKSEHSGLLTVSQKRWVDLLHRIQLTRPEKLPPAPSKKQWNYYPYKLLHGKWKNRWKYVIVSMIILNSLLLSVPWRELNSGQIEPRDNLISLRILYIVFQAFFVFVVFLNLISDGYVYFFLSARNTVEFFCALASVVYIILAVTFELIDEDGKNQLIEGLTSFALGLAVVRLISALWKFNVLVNLFYTVIATIINSIPLLGVLLVVILHYGLAGTIFFSNVRTGEAINYSFVNFSNTLNSLWIMVRVLTGEDWHLIMHDCAVSEPTCHCCDCGSKILSPLYFVSFNILIVFIFVNVFIAVLLESFSLFYNEDDSCLDHKVFVRVWSKFDHRASGGISRANIKLFLRCLKLDSLLYSYYIKDGVRERVKYCKKDHALLLREIALELSLENKTTGHSSQRAFDTSSENPITFENMLKTLAYRTEDIYKRLTPLELKAREEMEIDIQSRVAFDCVKIWMEKYVKPILLNLQNQLQEIMDPPAAIFHDQSMEPSDVQTIPKDLRRRRSCHRHSIVDNPQWTKYSETEQDLSDLNSASIRGTKQWLVSPSNSEDRPEIRESLKSSFKQGGQPPPQQSPLIIPTPQFDWRRWYHEKVDSDDD